MRVAAIDIGTNTVLLLVAESGSGGVLVAVEEHATITRLGKDVDRTRTLSPEAISRTNACLDRYAEIVRALGVERVAVVGTSAMRDARGGEAVRAHVRAKLGVDARVISGEEEARVSFAGAISGLGYDSGTERAVFDIGGGSTEVVLGTPPGTIRYAQSFDIGSVRLTERHVKSDPPTVAELHAVLTDARAAFAAVPPLATVPPSVPPGFVPGCPPLAVLGLGDGVEPPPDATPPVLGEGDGVTVPPPDPVDGPEDPPFEAVPPDDEELPPAVLGLGEGVVPWSVPLPVLPPAIVPPSVPPGCGDVAGPEPPEDPDVEPPDEDPPLEATPPLVLGEGDGVTLLPPDPVDGPEDPPLEAVPPEDEDPPPAGDTEP